MKIPVKRLKINLFIQIGLWITLSYSLLAQSTKFNSAEADLLTGRQLKAFQTQYPALPIEELALQRMDQTVNYINASRQFFPQFRGEGIHVSIKEFLFDTLDIDLIAGYKFSRTQLPVIRAHSSIMATMIGGKGNSSPSSIGVAPEVVLSSSSFVPALPDTGDYYRSNSISVQNHSYGEEINNEYSDAAYRFDLSTWKDTFLVHVFSSGNQGLSQSTTGIYKSIPGYSNLTGSFKMSKNSIAVGAVDSLNQLEEQSSRGPAYDGRIKPELVAFGVEGTSGAAALVSGTAALLQQAYKKDHKENLPSASLIKAVLINSAKDMGEPGPDYGHGFGKLNTLQALKTMTASKYFIGQLGKDQINRFPIYLPPNSTNLKITLTWQEPPGEILAGKALRNDLDLSLIDSTTGLVFYPYVLSVFPLEDSLKRPATTGRDQVNNVEQIIVAEPSSGWINIIIDGTLTDSLQKYSVAYDWDIIDQFDWTFPLPQDKLLGGQINTLRWLSTYDPTVTSVLEISLDSISWTTIIANHDLVTGQFSWHAPDTNALIYLRFRIDDRVYLTSCLVLQELNLYTGFICSDSAAVYWNRLPGVEGYLISMMDQGRMKVIQETIDTFFLFKSPALPFVAIAPKIRQITGPRYPAFNYVNQGVGCYIKQFLAQKLPGNSVDLTYTLGTSFALKSINLYHSYSFVTFVIFGTQRAPLPTSYSNQIFLKPGNNRFILFIELTNGKVISDTIYVFSLGNELAAIYPNPVRRGQSINLATPESSSFHLIINDLSGRRILNLPSVSTGSIELPDLSPGVYFVTFFDGRKTVFSEKLVVY